MAPGLAWAAPSGRWRSCLKHAGTSAIAAAIADAQSRAERLARLLGVRLGGVVSVSTSIFDASSGLARPDEDAGCTGQIGSSYDSQHGGLGITVPVFDPTQPAEITVATTLTIAYAIVGDG